MKRRWLMAALMLGLAGCSAFEFEDEEKAPLPGERISVLNYQRELEPDPGLEDVPVKLPPAVRVSDWLQQGGSPANAMPPIRLATELSEGDTYTIGDGTPWQDGLVVSPVVALGKVFVMDAEGEVMARDVENLSDVLWTRHITPEAHEDDVLGGGLASDGSRLFITTGYGHVVALDAKTGEELWRRQLDIPVRAAPKLASQRVFVTTVDNQIYAFNPEDGGVIWQAAGLNELVGYLGMAVPAIYENAVIVPFSSGELYAFDAGTGRELWQTMLSPGRRSQFTAQIFDITASPIAAGGWVFATNTNGVLAALDLKSGEFRWEQNIGSFSTPWIAGRFLYVLGQQNRLFAIHAVDGRIKWMTPLKGLEEDPDAPPRHWSGPVLAGERLLVVSNRGELVSVDPVTGEPKKIYSIPDGVTAAPVVAGETLYLVTRDAELVVMK